MADLFDVDLRCTDAGCAEPETYRLQGACGNCGAGPWVGLFTYGHPHGGVCGVCPACGCLLVHFSYHADLPAPVGLGGPVRIPYAAEGTSAAVGGGQVVQQVLDSGSGDLPQADRGGQGT